MKKTGNIEAIYPLSPLQEGILFHALYTPQTMGYFEQSSSTLEGELNVPAFEQAWQTIVARHPILRTLFTWEKRNQPLQIVRQKVRVPFAYQDWRSYSPSEQQKRLEAFLISDRRQGFDLSKAPLMRLAVMHLDERRYQFTWSFHHLLLDGWSGPIVLSEFFTLYEAYCRAERPALPHRRPYRDYISWLKEQDLTRTEPFWRTYLDGFTKPTPFGVDKPKSNEQKEAYAKQEFKLPHVATESLQRLAQQHHLTLSTLVHGIWAIILSRYSNEGDVVFGTTVSGRTAPLEDIENMVGLFINTLPLRVQLTPDVLFIEWLQSLQAQQTEMRLYEHSPLTHIQRCSRLPARLPLFESILVMDNYPMPKPSDRMQRSLRISEVRVFEQTNYPLTVQVVPSAQLLWQLQYDCSRFTDATISNMLGHIQTLLEGIVADPNRPLVELPWITETERQQLIVDWNDTRSDYPKDRCIHELFEAQVERTPDAVAVIFGEQEVSFKELNRRANKLARHLRSSGVGPNVLVGICTERSIEMLVGLLGIIKAGGAYVPLDPSYPKGRLAFMLQDSGISVLLTKKRLSETLPEHGAKVIYLDSDWKLIAKESDKNFDSGATLNNLAYAIYTSGSTGRPKGVLGLHQGAINRFTWMWQTYPFEAGEVCCQKTSISFVDSIWEIFGPLLKGIKSVIVPDDAVKEPRRFIEYLADEEITRVVMVPSYLRVMLDTHSDLQKRLPKLQFWISSGEILSKELCQRFYEKMPQRLLLNLYGSTEVSADVTCYNTRLMNPEYHSVPIGRPIANTQIYILGPDLQPVPNGVSGELHIGGDGLAAGYLNLSKITENAFIPNPFSDKPDSRLYKTGDKGRWLADGNIEYIGRVDHQVKIRGFRVELGEVASVVNKHPEVEDSVVLAREDRPDDKRMVAYVVLRRKPAIEIHELYRFLKQRLPDYMLPSAFVILDSLPLTPSGKIDRLALPAPGQTRPKPEDSYVAPRTPIEESLAGIWCKILNLDKVGIYDNFFDLGGHSLFATQVISRVISEFRVKVPLRSLFRAPTVADMAAAIVQKQIEKTETEGIEHMLAELEALSDEEARKLIKEKQMDEGNSDERF